MSSAASSALGASSPLRVRRATGRCVIRFRRERLAQCGPFARGGAHELSPGGGIHREKTASRHNTPPLTALRYYAYIDNIRSTVSRGRIIGGAAEWSPVGPDAQWLFVVFVTRVRATSRFVFVCTAHVTRYRAACSVLLRFTPRKTRLSRPRAALARRGN